MNQRARLAAGAAAVTVLAALSAFGVNQGVASFLSVDPSALVAVDAPAPGVAASTPRESSSRGLSASSQMEYRKTILGRNIFDHNAITVPVENEVIDGDGSVTKTSLPLVLVATMVAEPVTFSSALIKEEGSDARAYGYGIGDQIKDAEVIEIHQKKVILKRSDGSLEALLAGGEELEEAAPTGSAEEEGSEFDGVNQTGENSWEVDRSLLEKYMGDPSLLAGLGAARPHRSDGEVDGYRLYRIRRDSIGRALGLKNGDVVHSVNGRSLTNMSEAMQAFNELQSSGSFNFEVTRRGQKQTMEYSVK